MKINLKSLEKNPLKKTIIFTIFTAILLPIHAFSVYKPDKIHPMTKQVEHLLLKADEKQINGHIKDAEKLYFEAINTINEGWTWVALANFYNNTNQTEKLNKVLDNIRRNFHNNIIDIIHIDNKATILTSKNRERTSPKNKITGCFTKKGFVYAATENLYNQAVNLLLQNDTEALIKLTLKTGKIGISKNDIEVQKKSAGFFSGAIKIRPKGSQEWFFIAQEAVYCSDR